MLDQSDKIRCPVLFHYGGQDPYIPLEQAERVAACAASTRRHGVPHPPDAGHAFDNHDAPMFHQPEPAARAWQITQRFPRAHAPGLTGPRPHARAPDDRQRLLVQQPVGRERVATVGRAHTAEIGERAAGLLDDHLRRREIPQRHDRLATDLGHALRDQHVGPEVAEPAGSPAPPRSDSSSLDPAAIPPAVEPRDAQLRVLERAHR